MDYDMPPTARLSGLRFRGTVEQRIIANHPVPPAVLRHLVPNPAQLWTKDGVAWLSACFVQLRHVRPARLPRWAGVSMRYLVHRTMAQVPFPDGRMRKAVFVLEAYGDPALPRLAARAAGAPFRPAQLSWRRVGPGFHVRASAGGRTLYEATSRREFRSDRFGSLAEADSEILGMAWGSHYDGSAWRLFPETHDPWTPYGLRVRTAVYHLRDHLGGSGIEADHAIAMEDCPHEFGRTLRVPLGAPL